MTLGSLFSGTGGFELAGLLAGIKPKWNAEIVPFCQDVLSARFPDVPQLGDVTTINGGDIEPVDIITFGSPCQDLSQAGKQAGIFKGSRSNLFFEAVRIIKEMRAATNNFYPSYAVWENVPGAFTSNKGDDFHAVLTTLANIKNQTVFIPRPKRWGGSGCIIGDGYSIAWRVLDAQYWGVPQRRKRIYLLTDFTSQRAGEILFKPESSRGNSETRRKTWERTAEHLKGCTGTNCPTWLISKDCNSGTVYCCD